VDEEDGDSRLLPRLHGISPESAKARLRVKGAWPTSTAYWVAALRETFEETGVLLQRGGQGRQGEFAAEKEAHGQSEAERSARAALLAGSKSFAQVLEMLDAELDAGSLEYTGHWLTPECEPRRYETRFFSAEVSRAAQVTTHEREMVDSVWITPAEALARNARGTLPLVLPTVFTLEELAPFPTPREALAHMRNRPVPLRLPRPERVDGGVLFHLTEPTDLPGS